MSEQFDSESWRRWKTLFDEAADQDTARQEELLDLHCTGDPKLRERFSSMLGAHRQSNALIDRSLPDRFVALSAEIATDPPPPLPPLPAGTLLKDRYRIQDVIGSGGWSVVYLAQDEPMQGRRVVVKVLLHQSAQRSAIDDELAALSNLHHPGIAAPLDSGIAPDGRRFLVLAYIPGITLRVALRQEGSLDAGRVVRFLRAMGSALQTAHAEGVCHLDLKPENIMLQRHRDKDEPVIVDFGISQLLHSPGSSSGSPAGSLAYMAPEQLNGQAGTGSDQYSLALIAGKMLTGCKPPPLDSVTAVLAACQDLPPKARLALGRALSASPADRFPSIEAFVASFTAALDPERRRYRRLGAMAAAGFAILFMVSALYFWLVHRHEQQLIVSDMEILAGQMHTWVRMADSSHYQPGTLDDAFAQPLARLRRMVAEGHRDPALLTTLSESLALYGSYLGHPGRRNLGQSEKGIAALRQSVEVAEILGTVTPNRRWWRVFTAEKYDALASILVEAGEYEEASRIVRKGVALLENFPQSTDRYRGAMSIQGGLRMTLSRVYFHRRQFEECLRLRDQGVASRRLTLPMYGNSPPARYDLAGVLATRGYLLREMGRLDEAYRDYSESESILKPMRDGQSWNLQYRWLHARNLMEVGRLFLLKGQSNTAQGQLEMAASLMREMLDDARHEISSIRSYALCLSYLAKAKVRSGEPPRLARPLLDEAVQVNRTALDQDPANAKIRDERDVIFQNARDAGIHSLVISKTPLH